MYSFGIRKITDLYESRGDLCVCKHPFPWPIITRITLLSESKNSFECDSWESLLLSETCETKTTLDSYCTPIPMRVTNRKIHNRSFTIFVSSLSRKLYAIDFDIVGISQLNLASHRHTNFKTFFNIIKFSVKRAPVGALV